MLISPHIHAEFPKLFAQFASSFLHTSQGQNALRAHAQSRSQAQRSHDHLIHLSKRKQPIAESALSRLLPYENTLANFEQGCWIHPSQILSTDPRDLYPEIPEKDWLHFGDALFAWTQECLHAQDPEELQRACLAFGNTPPQGVLSTHTLSAILHALDPTKFALISSAVETLIHNVFDTPVRQHISSYPHTNRQVLHILNTYDSLWTPSLPQSTSTPAMDVLCVFARWYAQTHTTPSEQRAWAIHATSETMWARNEACVTFRQTRNDTDLNTLPPSELGSWSKPTDIHTKILSIRPKDTLVFITGEEATQLDAIGKATSGYIHTFEPPQHKIRARWENAHFGALETPLPELREHTILPISPEKLAALRKHTLHAPNQVDEVPEIPVAVSEAPDETHDQRPHSIESLDLDHPFSDITFGLLRDLSKTPSVDYYNAHKDVIETHVEWPLEQALRMVARNLSHTMRSALETEKRLFERIPRTEFGHTKARSWYQGILALEGIKRSKSPQLFIRVDSFRISAGFRIPRRAKTARTALLTNLKRHNAVLPSLLTDLRQWPGHLEYGVRGPQDNPSKLVSSWRAWVQDPETHGLQIATTWSAQDATQTTFDTVVRTIVRLFERLFPLILLTNHPNPLLAISEHTGAGYDEPILDLQPDPTRQSSQSLEEISNTSNIAIPTLERWVRALDRKGQAILYGPPGTGKTFLASLLAQHLIEGGDGFTDLVQFHPAYTYEDFIQGIRPQAREDGSLSYELRPGRFLDFCTKAQGRSSRCVLIIDEINRADISRVFGELMYVLEYRDREIPLASGGMFQIPEHVRIIGTMNTADRSIALVDHALRRRFAFFKLQPDVHVLRAYHSRTQTPVEGLIDVLTEINRTINDPHYALGISFFLTPDLRDTLEDIWVMEIEPYLEEYFFDQPENVSVFRWSRVARRVLPPATNP